MNKNSLNIISLLCVVAIFPVLLNSYARAGISKEPVVIRKKITVQNQKNFRNAVPERRVKTLTPKSDTSVILEGAGQEEIGATGTKFGNQVVSRYDPAEKIDPFEPLFKETPEIKSGDLQPVDPKGNTPLENIDLSQLKLTGIILAASGNKALLREASGRGYVISAGTPIGTHGGRVAGVLKDKVIVKERMKDRRGRFFFQETELKLNKPSS